QLDTVPANKLNYVKSTAESLIASQNYAAAGKWYAKILDLKKDYGKVDLYYAGYNYYRGGAYQQADSIFTIYENKYPEDMFGWYLAARSKEGIDTTGEQGLAKPDYEKIIMLADTVQDKQSIKDKLIPAYRYMVAYYYNIKHDRDSSILYNNKILEIDSADATALKTKDALSAVPKQKATTEQPKTPAKKNK
ncbi:MAG: hypothetical protein ACRDE8_16435, partial [Ginsengibacter sp.]